MGIPTLIKTLTADNDTSLSFVDGTSDVVLDSTYDEYMFVFTDIGPATDSVEFQFQVNASAQSGYNETMTTTFFETYHQESDGDANIGYRAASDQAQGTAYQQLAYDLENDADGSCAGILHLFSPSNTTYVTHFYSRFSAMHTQPMSSELFAAGYINVTAAIDEISFAMSSGNFDGVIQMYGIS